MKKIMLLSIMLLAVAITGCEKNDAEPSKGQTQTLEQKYPEWVNLTFIERFPADIYHKWMSIKIENNQVLCNSGSDDFPNLTITFKQMSVELYPQSTSTLKVGKVYFFNYYQGDGFVNEFEMNLISERVKIYCSDCYFLLKINKF